MDRQLEFDRKVAAKASELFLRKIAVIPAGYVSSGDWLRAGELADRLGITRRSPRDLLRVLYETRPRPESVEVARREVDILTFDLPDDENCLCVPIQDGMSGQLGHLAGFLDLESRQLGGWLSGMGVRKNVKKRLYSDGDILRALVVALAKRE